MTTTIIHVALFWASAIRLLKSRGPKQAGAFFALVYSITLAAERWGQEHGLFGVRYFYDARLWPGPALGALPFFVPCMWFAMMVPSQDLAFALLRGARIDAVWVRALAIAFVGASLMTAWDLLLDPISVARGMWRWEGAPYPFFDVPMENLAAWFIGTFGTHLILFATLPAPPPRVGASAAIYAATGFAYLPFLPDPRLALVSAAMLASALAAVGSGLWRPFRPSPKHP